ncbi:O-antigen ligase family protein [Paraburkholderia sp. Ac-20340]|uniref:O-antigen ligase family protein n=1 Tax=Paraburkholderia sp. Ac-20340 TaxID=2703888 RepID=UPI001981508A|nr:O-antigen ligase family protein [Paraburkholderia sp. Ac-20340]MBN3857305.1 O-antigen ligase family protein [Paraburkholderia sp. Ac-20340]
MNQDTTTSLRRLAPFVSLLLILGPATNLVWRGGTGYAFFLLLALALWGLYAFRRTPGYFAPWREYGWYTAAMLVPIAVIVLQQALMRYWAPHQFDALSRFTLALPIFLLLSRVPSRYLTAIGWGCAFGALAASAWVIIDRPVGGWSETERLTNSYTNAIPFGDTALLLAFLAIFTFGWDRKARPLALAVKLVALVAGGFVSYLSGTRGGWIAIPVFMLLLGVQYGWFAHWKRVVVAVALLAAFIGALLSTDRIQHRIADADADVALMQRGDKNTSVGLRLQLWSASIHLFERHPVYGVGKGHLEAALGDLANRGEASHDIVNERAHSDFFSAIAEMGAMGALSLLTIYFGTSLHFWRARRDSDTVIRTAACSGLAVSFSTILFGLTIDVLVPIQVVVLVSLLTVTFLAIIVSRRREIATGI